MANDQGILDRVAGWLSPTWQAQREEARAQIEASRTQSEAYQQMRRTLARQSRMSSGYRGGVTTRLESSAPSSWPLGGGMRHLTGSDLTTLRDRSRHLVRNNVLASSLLNASVDYVIGHGTRMEPATTDQTFNRAAQEKWNSWWMGEDGSSPDVRGLCSGPEIERLMWTSRLRDGDIGAILLGDGRLQLIEGHLIETPHGDQGKHQYVEGVELNRVGRPVRFWIRTVDQDNPFRMKWQPVNAPDFLFAPRLKRPGQIRGETAFAQSYEVFEHLEGYMESTVVAARMACNFGLILRTTPKAFSSLSNTLEGGDGIDRKEFPLEPGMVYQADTDQEVTQVKPEHPTVQFDAFVKSLARFAGLELRLPQELVLMLFESSYSASRAALITAQRSAKAEHKLWTCRVMSRIYRWKISEWIKRGELPEPREGVQPWKHRAIQQPHDYLDPVKEVQGIGMARDLGIKTHSEILQERGTTLDEFITTKRQEQRRLERAEIKLAMTTNTRGGGDGETEANPMAVPGQQRRNANDDNGDQPEGDDDE